MIFFVALCRISTNNVSKFLVLEKGVEIATELVLAKLKISGNSQIAISML